MIMGCNESKPRADVVGGVKTGVGVVRTGFRRWHIISRFPGRPMTTGEEEVMRFAPPALTDPVPRRSPGARRVLAEQRFRHTAWIERKPGAMWDAVSAAPGAAVR
ncbi:hypothetical protein GCM10010470_53590 [Saccharopolyspora taberi]|uniref:Uncharacterized protein n=2 Tax=Saccharopolyspora taberi TaxID=60895 RepID=A0ABN3VKT9_9PSEU